MIPGYEVCRLYTAIKRHFDGKYDYFKYDGQIKLTVETYEAKPTRNRFEYVGSKFNDRTKLEEYMLATIIASPGKAWIGDISAPEAKQAHLEWEGRMQSLNYSFQSELKRLMLLHDGFNKLFTVSPNDHPQILKALLRRELSLESFVMLDIATDFIVGLDRRLDDVIWKSTSLKARCYRPFIERRNVDKKVLRTILAQTAKDLGLTK